MTTNGDTPPKLPAIIAGGAVKALIPQSFDEAWRIALAVTRAGLAPYGLETPEKCMVAIMHGLEVGLPPMAALQSIAVINGRPSVYGDGVMGLVRASGQLEWIKEDFVGEGDSLEASCAVKRKGDPEPVYGTFSVAQAKTSGLWAKTGRNGAPTPWQLYPRRMLQIRARTYALRDAFADVLRGLSVAEEQEDIVRLQETTEAPPAPPAAIPAPVPPTPVVETPQTKEEVWEEVPGTVASASGGASSASKEASGASGGVASASGVSEDHDPETGELLPDEVDELIPPLPPSLDRRKDAPRAADAPVVTDVQVAEWFQELQNAFGGCEDLASLGAEQEKRMLPMRRRVSTAAWKTAERLVETHLLRLRE